MNITNLSDEDISEFAHPIWDELVRASNAGDYGAFTQRFSRQLLLAMNEVEVGKQFAHSELAKNLVEKQDFLGFIRRGEHVTALYRVRSKVREGEWLGRMVLGTEDGEVKVFAASIF